MVDSFLCIVGGSSSVAVKVDDDDRCGFVARVDVDLLYPGLVIKFFDLRGE